MNKKEARRLYVIEKAVAGDLIVKKAAELLNLSGRQVKRLKEGMKEEGVSALAQHRRFIFGQWDFFQASLPKYATVRENTDLNSYNYIPHRVIFRQ